MKRSILVILFACMGMRLMAQEFSRDSQKKWGIEFYALWPVFPGNIYKAQVTKEVWRKNDLAGDIFAGLHSHPSRFREDEGYFGNLAFTFGYRQFFWKGLHAELYQAFGPGWNRDNVIDGQDYMSWDYEIGLLGGYRFEFFSEEKRANHKFSPYISSQHGLFFLAAQSNPHPIRNSDGERPFYVGTFNIGVKF